MTRKRAIKKLMGMGYSRNEANARLMDTHSLRLSNRFGVLFQYFMMQADIPNYVEVLLMKSMEAYNISKSEVTINEENNGTDSCFRSGFIYGRLRDVRFKS